MSEMSESLSPGTLSPGTLVTERYEIEATLNEGALVEAYRARDVQRGETVLLKCLSAAVAEDGEAVERFVQQFETLSALAGAHVVVPKVCERSDQGRHFIVTEFLDGLTLKERLAQSGPLPANEVVELICQACLGLQDAHVRKIIHRDIKPSNLFLARDQQGQPQLKLIDFEMAKVAYRNLTREGQALGSAMYMSPEQMRSAQAITPSADIWSLGVTMYELLSAKRPFEATNIQALVMSVLNDEPVPLEQRDPSLPPGLVAIVHRCLSKLPQERFGTAGQLRDALLQFASRPEAYAAREVRAVADLAQTELAPLAPRAASSPAQVSPDWSRGAPVASDAPSVLPRPAVALLEAGRAPRAVSPAPAVRGSSQPVRRGSSQPSPQGSAVPILLGFVLPITGAVALAAAFWWLFL